DGKSIWSRGRAPARHRRVRGGLAPTMYYAVWHHHTILTWRPFQHGLQPIGSPDPGGMESRAASTVRATARLADRKHGRNSRLAATAWCARHSDRGSIASGAHRPRERRPSSDNAAKPSHRALPDDRSL